MIFGGMKLGSNQPEMPLRIKNRNKKTDQIRDEANKDTTKGLELETTESPTSVSSRAEENLTEIKNSDFATNSITERRNSKDEKQNSSDDELEGLIHITEEDSEETLKRKLVQSGFFGVKSQSVNRISSAVKREDGGEDSKTATNFVDKMSRTASDLSSSKSESENGKHLRKMSISDNYSDSFDSDSSREEEQNLKENVDLHVAKKKADSVPKDKKKKTAPNRIQPPNHQVKSTLKAAAPRRKPLYAPKKPAPSIKPNKTNNASKSLEDLTKKNVGLRKLPARQTAALSRLNRAPIDERVSEEMRIMKEQIRQYREQLRKQDLILRERNMLLQKTLDKKKELEMRVKEQGAPTVKKRPVLIKKQLDDLQVQLEAKDATIRTLERKIELKEKNHRHQFNIEVARHKTTLEKLRALEDESKYGKLTKKLEISENELNLLRQKKSKSGKKKVAEKNRNELEPLKAAPGSQISLAREKIISDNQADPSKASKSRKISRKTFKPTETLSPSLINQTSNWLASDQLTAIEKYDVENEDGHTSDDDRLMTLKSESNYHQDESNDSLNQSLRESTESPTLEINRNMRPDPTEFLGSKGTESKKDSLDREDSGFQSIKKETINVQRENYQKKNERADSLLSTGSPATKLQQTKIERLSFESDENPFDALKPLKQDSLTYRKLSDNSSILDEIFGPKRQTNQSELFSNYSAVTPPVLTETRKLSLNSRHSERNHVFELDNDELFPSLARKPAVNGTAGAAGRPLVDKGLFPWENPTVKTTKRILNDKSRSNGYVI